MDSPSIPVINWPGHESDQSPPLSAEVKNEGRYKSAFPIQLHGLDRDIFSFTFCHNINNPVLCRDQYSACSSSSQSEWLMDVKI